MAHPSGKDERVRCVLRGDVEFRAGLLGWARQRGSVLDRVETPAMADVLLRQQQLDLFDTLAEAGDRFIRRAAEAAKLVRQKGAGEPDIEAPAADRIQHPDFTGELQRMIEDRQHRTCHQPRPTRALSRSGEKQHRVGAVPVIVMKIMLDDADVREPEFLGLFRKIERLAKVVGSGFLLGPDIGKKLHAEFHFVPVHRLHAVDPFKRNRYRERRIVKLCPAQILSLSAVDIGFRSPAPVPHPLGVPLPYRYSTTMAIQ
jgi:hypothetical protein